MKIDKQILEIINRELGKKSADLFIQFYHGFPLQDQLTGAKNILSQTVGTARTNTLLKPFYNKNKDDPG